MRREPAPQGAEFQRTQGSTSTTRAEDTEYGDAVRAGELEADAAADRLIARMMVKIQRGWRPASTDQQVFEQTRGHWRIAPWVRGRACHQLGVQKPETIEISGLLAGGTGGI